MTVPAVVGRGVAEPGGGRLKARQGLKDVSKPNPLPDPTAIPELRRVGTGWLGQFQGDVTIKVVHLKERSDEYTGEFTITCPSVSTIDHRLEWGRFNLLSARTRKDIATRLGHHVEGRWEEMLDAFCHEVVRLERKGVALEYTDPAALRHPLRYLLRPFLPFGMPTLLYGEGGTGKSTIAAAIALSVQTGSSVFPGWEIARADTMPVLILDWEATREVWEDRLNRVAEGAGLKPERMAYRPCRRRLVDDAEAIADMIVDNNFGLVIVDAVNQAFGVSHQEADPAEAAIKAFSTIREVSGTDVTWLLIDHVTGETMREGQTQNGYTPLKAYGSVSKQWLARQQFYLAASREATENRQELVLKHTKANYSWKMPPQGMVVSRENGAIRISLNERIESADLAGQLTWAQRIASVLFDGPADTAKLKLELGLTNRKSDNDKLLVTLGRMVKRGEAIKTSTGMYDRDPGHKQAELAPEDTEAIG